MLPQIQGKKLTYRPVIIQSQPLIYTKNFRPCVLKQFKFSIPMNFNFFFIQAIVKLVIFVLYNASYLHISFWMTFHPHAWNMDFCQLNQQLESFGKVGLLWYLHHSLGISFLSINKILCSQKKTLRQSRVTLCR